MRIIILGAGQIGETLARNLVSEDNDIVLIDQDATILNDIRSHIDVQTIVGNAASPNILLEAGIEQTDLVIAVTANDEINMLACLFATKIFQIPRTIARIRSHDYHEFPELFNKKIIPIQTIIYPTHAVVQHIIRLIKYPDFTQILSFSQDKICLVTFDVRPDDWVNGKTIAEIRHQIADNQINIVALFNNKTAIFFDEAYLITEKDKILFISYTDNLYTLLTQLKRPPKHNSRIMLAGGGRIGGELAKHLESDYQIKLIEKSPEKVAKNAAQLNKTLVIEGDVSDRELLINENIEDIDMFCAITDHDETNIMASLQAKYLGAKYAMALVNHENYIDLIDDSVIDTALSPQTITIGSILSKIRHGNMVRVHRLQEEEAEAIELVVEGSDTTSAIIGRPISEIELPPGCIVAGVVRNKKLHFAQSNLLLAPQDHVVLLLLQQKYIHQLEALFAVNLTFMS